MEHTTIYIPKDQFLDLSDKTQAIRDIESSILLLLNNKKYTALLLFILCCIDTFSSLSKKSDKNAFIEYVGRNYKPFFKNKILTPEDIYFKYRCSIVHNYTIEKDFCIAEDHEIEGKLVANTNYGITLNIDKFANEFVKNLRYKQQI